MYIPLANGYESKCGHNSVSVYINTLIIAVYVPSFFYFDSSFSTFSSLSSSSPISYLYIQHKQKMKWVLVPTTKS